MTAQQPETTEPARVTDAGRFAFPLSPVEAG
jgi:hypothetical protein